MNLFFWRKSPAIEPSVVSEGAQATVPADAAAQAEQPAEPAPAGRRRRAARVPSDPANLFISGLANPSLEIASANALGNPKFVGNRLAINALVRELNARKNGGFSGFPHAALISLGKIGRGSPAELDAVTPYLHHADPDVIREAGVTLAYLTEKASGRTPKMQGAGTPDLRLVAPSVAPQPAATPQVPQQRRGFLGMLRRQ